MGTLLGSSKKEKQLGWGRRADGSQGVENAPAKGAAETPCLRLFDTNCTERRGSEQAAALPALGMCQPQLVKALLLEDCTSPRKTQRTFSCFACFTAHSSLKLRSPAGGQNILLTLATAPDSVYGSKCLRERKHYVHPRCSPAPGASAANSGSWPCFKVARVFPPPQPLLVKAIELK